MLRRALLAVVLCVGVVALPACTGGGGGYEVTAYFDKTVSLYPKGDVKILGLSSGKISEVKVVGTQVRVRMKINQDTPLPENVQATIVPLSLIGERYVQLFPAWRDGEPRAKAGAVIPQERTSIPVEPDEALAALKKFLDTLDPNATGRLVQNLADDLKGNGQSLNDTLGQFAQLSTTIAAKDQELSHLIDNFDKFTATLRTRESQLGKVMDQFAGLTSLLAQERDTITKLVNSLAQVSTSGLELVNEHAGPLNTDLKTLTETLHIVSANMDNVRKVLSSGPMLIAGDNLDGEQGLISAYDPPFKHIDLRQSTSPTVGLLLDALGIPAFPRCLPIDVSCPTAASASNRSVAPAAAGRPSGVQTLQADAPVDAIVGFLGSPTATGTGAGVAASRTSTLGAADALPAPRRTGWTGWLRKAARSITEALS